MAGALGGSDGSARADAVVAKVTPGVKSDKAHWRFDFNGAVYFTVPNLVTALVQFARREVGRTGQGRGGWGWGWGDQ